MIRALTVGVNAAAIPAIIAAILTTARSARDRTTTSARLAANTTSLAAALLATSATLGAIIEIDLWITALTMASTIGWAAIAWMSAETAIDRRKGT
jgi:hypothetical protein